MLFRARAAASAALALAAVLPVLVPATAHAQLAPYRQYTDEPTVGVNLPMTPLAGEHDARAVSLNPAGLHFLRGRDLVLAFDLADADTATAGGQGIGAFVADVLGGGLLPRLELGLGLEALAASRTRITPDPGSPVRFTYAQSLGLGRDLAIGASWHHFFDSGALRGLDTFDLGASWRLGNRLALGGVLRDVGAPGLAGATVQRRYELELTARPTGTDRLDVGLGGRYGEERDDVDGWLRGSLRVARGVVVHASAESRALRVIENTVDRRVRDQRELAVIAGVELTLGRASIAAFGRGRFDDEGKSHPTGGSLVAHLSAEPPPSLLGHRDRIERIDFTAGIDGRELTSLVVRLRGIERDPTARAVVITLDGVDAGWATLEELRDALLRVRKAGKKVFAYMVVGTGRDYWLASAADRIYIDPAGGVRLAGFSGTALYFKGAFDMLGVHAQFEKIAEYKSAPEAYTDTGASAPAMRMRNELYDSLWGEFVAGIAAARKLDRATVLQLIDQGPYTAGDLARDPRLVDAVADPDKVTTLVARELGGLYPVDEAPRERPPAWQSPAIAVIYAEGDIVDGKSMDVPLLGRRVAGGETVAAAIAGARASDEVKAIVLRIDSPGGSALASELMAREVFKTRGVKPIICSMGDVAASGGYFLAAGCDVIFADRTTITGSIGIFTGKFDVSGLIAKLGITAETFRRGRRADMESLFRPYTDEERALVHDGIRYFYGRFTAAVAEGRNLSQREVDAVGRGRVWSGLQAKDVGLVDRFGGLVDALALARQRAGLTADERVRLIALPRPELGLLERVLGGAMRVRAPALRLRDLPGGAAIADAIPASLWVEPDAPQARLPFTIRWQ